MNNNNSYRATPVVLCSSCGRVGYLKERWSARRTWATLQEANNDVVLNGNEETTLCPHCLDKKLKGSRSILVKDREQIDLF